MPQNLCDECDSCQRYECYHANKCLSSDKERASRKEVHAKFIRESKPKTAIELLKVHVAWLEETSRNQLFDAHVIGKMIEEAEKRAGERE